MLVGRDIGHPAPAGGDANPFGDFYRGFGTLGRLNNNDATPPDGTQAGDVLYAMSTSSSIAGWTQSFSVGINEFSGHVRVATGDANDIIPANLCNNTGTLIWGVRANSDFTTTGSKSANSQTVSSADMDFPAAPLLGFEPGASNQYCRLNMFAGWASSLSSAVSVDAPAEWTKCAEIVDDTFKFVTIFGVSFEVPSVGVGVTTATYATSTVASKLCTTWGQVMQNLNP